MTESRAGFWVAVMTLVSMGVGVVVMWADLKNDVRNGQTNHLQQDEAIKILWTDVDRLKNDQRIVDLKIEIVKLTTEVAGLRRELERKRR